MTLRFIGQMMLSAVLAVVSVYMLLILGERMLRDVGFVRELAQRIFYSIGEGVVFLIASLLLFAVYLTLFQWRWFRYVAEMNRSVKWIADGHFDDQIPIKQKNQLGDLAYYTNRLVTQLKQSLDDERRAEQTKNELITNVSHDLRTPLTSILGYLGLIEQDRYRDEVELRHYVQIAYEKSQRLHVLIQDLFVYTRMRHDSLPVRQVRLNLTELLEQLLLQNRIALEEAGMQGTVHRPSSGGSVYVAGDPNKLVRVFENLLMNAVLYGREGRRVDIAVRVEGSIAVTEVVNYGDPIPAVDLPHLFDRFYRVDKSRTAHSGGSGLGLAIAKSIVEQHGGTIGAASDSGQTRFQVRLPLDGASNSEQTLNQY
jgi:signal transduction histidine kinase